MSLEKTIVHKAIISQGSMSCFKAWRITPIINVPTPIRYDILPAVRICIDSLSSDDFSLKRYAANVRKEMIKTTINIDTILSGMER